MDVNAGTKPISSADNALNKQESPKAEDVQATVLPFQSVLDAQQPRPEKPAQVSAANGVKNNQHDAAARKPAGDAKTTAAQKQTSEDTLAQLNFSRRLQGDTTTADLNPKLLQGAEDGNTALPASDEADNALLTALKERLTGRDGTVAEKPVTETKLHIDDSGKNSAKTAELQDDILVKTDDKPLITDEKIDSRTLFTDEKSKPRVDQPRFSLADAQKADPKTLADDFMPLNKKSADTTTPLSLVSVTENNSDNSKSAFSIKTENSAFQTVTAPGAHTALQSPAMMPSAAQVSATQAAAPTAQAMPLTGQLGSELWQQQVSQNIAYFSRQGLQQAQLRLHPEELGSLNIHLKIEDNQAVMHFVSPHSHVRAAMESMMPVLRSALQESGINLAQSSVGQEYHGDQQNSGEGQNARQSGESLSAAGNITGLNIQGDTTVSRVAHSAALARGGIDTFA
ncbi:flagellar hook-length control protein FliK [Morganella psychrotolerans]|uniref:Flagellar hook-length control protein FliK n=1 Tax=Morganella psychrotolerans TaxID=368603 RepID=A0A5M9RA80_9GAMM|nr:flagellar hook-length control protein FliK [Morganella psychrotolerans]KAA8717511.1 flagellar hook-length control protein FliK [Morganella psychrotolerans]